MRIKSTLTTLSAIIALAMMATSVCSQNFSLVKNMGATLNSTSNDQNQVISPNGLSLYFASNRAGNLDIYVSHRATLNSIWGPPVLVTALNSIDEDIPGSISLDGKTMFLQSTRMPPGLGGRDIYISMRIDPSNDLGWATPMNLGAVVNTALDDLIPAYFEDPTTGVNSIVFSSNRIGNPATSYHLYQSTRNTDGTFNTPTPVSELNVIGAEVVAAIRRDGLEIFVSAIPPLPGTYGIWVSTRSSTTSPWSAPTLVPGINTAADGPGVSLSPDGSILYFESARAVSSGGFDLYSATRCSLYSTSPCNANRSNADFDGDGNSDISVFRPTAATWYILQSSNSTMLAQPFGMIGDKIVPGDYDGDGRTDFAVFRPSNGIWYYLRSSDGSFQYQQFGTNGDVPAPGDYDSDGKTDFAVFRSGVWYIKQSSNGIVTSSTWGLSTDIPVAGANVP